MKKFKDVDDPKKQLIDTDFNESESRILSIEYKIRWLFTLFTIMDLEFMIVG